MTGYFLKCPFTQSSERNFGGYFLECHFTPLPNRVEAGGSPTPVPLRMGDRTSTAPTTRAAVCRTPADPCPFTSRLRRLGLHFFFHPCFLSGVELRWCRQIAGPRTSCGRAWSPSARSGAGRKSSRPWATRGAFREKRNAERAGGGGGRVGFHLGLQS